MLKHISVLFFLSVLVIPNAAQLCAQVTNTDLGWNGINPYEVTQDRLYIQPYARHAGTNLPYRLFLPPDFNPTNKYPLVMALHGNGAEGTNNTLQLAGVAVSSTCWPQIQAEYPSIVILPQAAADWAPATPHDGVPDRPWIAAAIHLLQRFSEKDFVDRRRVYVYGSSKGGQGAFGIAYHQFKWITAIVPNIAGGEASEAYRIMDTPMWAQVGRLDGMMFSDSLENYNAVAALSGDTQYTVETLPEPVSGDPMERFDLSINNGLFTWSYYPDQGHSVYLHDNLELINWLYTRINTNTIYTIPSNTVPMFSSSPLVLADALPLEPYNTHMRYSVTDADHDPLFYRQLSGPAWLSIDETGKITGIPAVSDIGLNSWTFDVWDGRGDRVQTTLNIDVLPDTIPPETPTNVLAEPGDHVASITWDDSTDVNISHYNLYRSDTSGVHTNLLVGGLTSSYYVDQNVTNDRVYYYVVSAVDIFTNESPVSMEVSVVPRLTGEIIPRVLVRESFDYAPGTEALTGRTPPVGSGLTNSWSSSQVDIIAGSLSGPDGYGLIPAGNRIYDIAHSSSLPLVELDNDNQLNFIKNQKFYISFLMNYNHISWVKSGLVLYEGDTKVVQVGHGHRGLYANMGGSEAYGPQNPTNTDLLVVAKIETVTAGQDKVSVSFFTDSVITEPATWQVSASAEVSAVIDRLGFGFYTRTDESIQFDEITIGTTFDSVVRQIGLKPIAPLRLTATPLDEAVFLDWDDNPEPEVESYTVYRSTVSGSYGDPLTNNISLSEFTDTAVTNGRVYFYRVTAVNTNSLESDPSGQVFAFPATETDYKPVFIPEPFTNSSATAGVPYTGAITNVMWDIDSTNHFYFKISGPDWLTVETNGTIHGTPTISDSGSNVFTVQVVGPGGEDTAAMYIAVEGAGLSAPTGLAATAGNGSVSLSWNDNSEGDLDSYSVYRSTTSGSGYSEIANSLSSSETIDTSAVNGTTYYYVVTAVDTSTNESANSSEVSATPVEGTPPVAGTIGWQAEDFVSEGGDGFDVGTDANALGGEYIETVSGGFSAPNSTVTYTITEPTGGSGYNLYIRYIAPDGKSDSFFAPDAIGSNPAWTKITGVPELKNDFFWANVSADTPTPTYTLASGTNTLVFGGRESGFLIDAFVLSTNASLSAAQLDAAVLNEGPAQEGYAVWAAGWSSNIGAATNDFDADGLNNLYEYALGGDPTNALVHGSVPTFTKSGNGFIYVHPMRSDDGTITYLVETATNLTTSAWTNQGVVAVGTNVTGGDLDFVTNEVGTVENEKFIQLKIEQQ